MKRLLVLLVCLCIACNGRGCPLKKKFGDNPESTDWGIVSNPEGDCTITRQGSRLVIVVPNTPHDLNPAMGMSAPRVLQEMEGDFVATVKVRGDFEPDRGFNGAGLLVWADERNFARLERNRWSGPGLNQMFCYPPLFEYYKNGVFQNTNPLPTDNDFFGPDGTWLRLERRDNRLTAFYSQDGREWRTVYTLGVDFPARVQVGVAAVNTSQKPFTVTFEDFTLDAR